MARAIGVGRSGGSRPLSFLITGGAGFIGSHLAEALLGRGDSVTVLDDLSTGRRENLAQAGDAGRFRLVVGSVLDSALVSDLVAVADVVVHLAAVVGVRRVLERPAEALVVNISGTENVMGAAARHDRIVLLASSSEVYGPNSGVPTAEDDGCVPGPTVGVRWSYAAGKLAGEALARAYRRECGTRVIVVRLFNTVGPRQRPEFGMVVPRLARQAVTGEPLTIFGDGTQTRCFCHVDDVVTALLALLDHPSAAGEVFNVGSGEEVTILELARRLIVLSGSHSVVRLVPYDEAYEPGFQATVRRVPDTSKLVGLTGWRPTRSLDEALTAALADASAEARGAGIRYLPSTRYDRPELWMSEG